MGFTITALQLAIQPVADCKVLDLEKNVKFPLNSLQSIKQNPP